MLEAYLRGIEKNCMDYKGFLALLYQNPNLPLDAMHCGDYEVGFDPLDDIRHHIEILLTELQQHLPRKYASELNGVQPNLVPYNAVKDGNWNYIN
jgi:hypothetical protein